MIRILPEEPTVSVTFIPRIGGQRSANAIRFPPLAELSFPARRNIQRSKSGEPNLTRFIAAVGLIFWLTCMPTNAQTEAPRLRLPTTVTPLRYSADLHMTPGEDHFAGSIAIDLRITQPVSTVWIFGKSLVFDKVSFRVGGHDVVAQATADKNDFIAITAGSPLPVGDATLRITYTGEVSRTLTDGAFQQQSGSDLYIFTKFEPVTARRAFPCFDEPSFKVPWQLTLHVPKDLKAFSNTDIVSETDEPME